MYTSHPAGAQPCDACGESLSPTISFDDGGGTLTACEGCRLPFEDEGLSTARATEIAIAEAICEGGVPHRRDTIALYRHRNELHQRRNTTLPLWVEAEAA